MVLKRITHYKNEAGVHVHHTRCQCGERRFVAGLDRDNVGASSLLVGLVNCCNDRTWYSDVDWRDSRQRVSLNIDPASLHVDARPLAVLLTEANISECIHLYLLCSATLLSIQPGQMICRVIHICICNSVASYCLSNILNGRYTVHSMRCMRILRCILMSIHTRIRQVRVSLGVTCS